MDKDELIKISKNTVGQGEGFGTPSEHSLMTSSEFVYRVTGMDQILDIIECGYVRPKGFGKRFNRVGPVVYWSQGGGKHHYDDKRPVLMAESDKVINGQVGAIHITNLAAIWLFNNEKQLYENKLKEILNIYKSRQQEIELAENIKSK